MKLKTGFSLEGLIQQHLSYGEPGRDESEAESRLQGAVCLQASYSPTGIRAEAPEPPLPVGSSCKFPLLPLTTAPALLAGVRERCVTWYPPDEVSGPQLLLQSLRDQHPQGLHQTPLETVLTTPQASALSPACPLGPTTSLTTCRHKYKNLVSSGETRGEKRGKRKGERRRKRCWPEEVLVTEALRRKGQVLGRGRATDMQEQTPQKEPV